MIGGAAVVLRGYVRPIADLDFAVDCTPDEISRAMIALGALGFAPSIPLPLSALTVLRMFDRSQREVNVFARPYVPFAELWAGITPYWRVHHGMTLSIYYRDPDGNRMEFQVDCCADAEEAHAFMHSEGFAANPVGVEINPEALLAQYRGGVPAEMLLAFPEGAPSPIPPEHGLS